MRKTAIALALTLVLSVSAQRAPESFFDTKEELLASVKEGFGGGSSDELKVGEKNVLIRYHYASGVNSCDAAIYVEVKNGWRLAAYYTPIFNDSIEAVSKGTKLELLSHKENKSLLVIDLDPK